MGTDWVTADESAARRSMGRWFRAAGDRAKTWWTRRQARCENKDRMDSADAGGGVSVPTQDRLSAARSSKGDDRARSVGSDSAR